MSTQWARMDTLQNQMLSRINPRNSLLSGTSPSQKDNTIDTLLRNSIDDLLREALPSLVSVRVGLVCPHSQARVQHQDAAVGPWRQESALVRWGLEVGVVLF